MGTWPDWVIVGFTLALTVLGGLQYCLDRRTATETKDALTIARLSAEAARDSAKFAKVSAEALMDAERARFMAQVQTWSEADCSGVEITLTNVGRTLGTIHLFHVAAHYDDNDLMGELYDIHPWFTTGVASRERWSRKFVSEIRPELYAGYVIYSDVFARFERHVFAFKYDSSLGQFLPEEAHWRFEHLDRVAAR